MSAMALLSLSRIMFLVVMLFNHVQPFLFRILFISITLHLDLISIDGDAVQKV